MRVILRRLEALGGLAVATDESLEVDRVTIGRGTDQDVQLPDVRVTLAHAEIRPLAAGGWRIECLGENPVWINGSRRGDAALDAGDTIDCGRFRLTVLPLEEGADLVLQVEERVSTREDKGRRRQAFQLDLAQAGLRKRPLAWGLALAGLVALLALPALLRFGPGSAVGASLDLAAQPGPPSPAHSAFIRNCATCHATAFEAVANEACLACHKAQPHHSDRAEMLRLGDLAGARCGSCHVEHRGHALVARNPALCTDCHADPDRDFAEAELPPVHRFDGDHPAFRLNLTRWDGTTPHRADVLQGATPLTEESHLKFPHDKHLAAAGVNSPDGKRVLACAECHTLRGNAFAPIRMDQCGSCHRLGFDPAEPDRELTHAAPRDVVAMIRDHFARRALAGGVEDAAAPEAVRMLRRPGEAPTAQQREVAMSWAEQRTKDAIDDVFSRRVCVTCHVVEPGADPSLPWAIAPVVLASSYMPGARFDHLAHRTQSCEHCHAAKTSKVSTDVLIPDIANCRECHGDPGASKLVGTACVDCHGFHIAGKTVFGPPAERR